MPPLARQRTLESVLSWWSDSNPALGPTFNLHAVAKPLMKFMYHRDALAFIAKNRGTPTPLSSEDMAIYSSYLAFKYVSSSTKAEILCELGRRANTAGDARTITESFGFQLIDELLSSPVTAVCRETCGILGQLARHETTLIPLLRLKPCQRLVGLLHDKQPGVIASAAKTLSWIARSDDGAEAALSANILDSLVELLASPHPGVRKWTCELLAQLTRYEIALLAILRLEVCPQLVFFLRDEDPRVIASAAKALNGIARSAKGARAVFNADVLDCVEGLFQSPHPGVQKWTRELLVQLTCHEFIPHAVSPSARLISLLRDENPTVIEHAAEVLSLCLIANSLEGVHAVMSANILDYVEELLQYPSPQVREAASKILLELARRCMPSGTEHEPPPFMDFRDFQDCRARLICPYKYTPYAE
ncbi:armadillo-type protein [Mycena latifolia]|nr:armadillo-type protein [Mycena latifolia]